MKAPSKTVRITRAALYRIIEAVTPKVDNLRRCRSCHAMMVQTSPPYILHADDCAAAKMHGTVVGLINEGMGAKRALTIIIPSRNTRNLASCVAAINMADSQRIIVVDDGLMGTLDDDLSLMAIGPSKLQFVKGEQPFIFARNINIGIRAAGDDDVLLLNDDALLETPGGFTAMAQVQRMWPDVGIIGPVTNSSGNPDQLSRCGRTLLRPTQRTVPFLCVFIPRKTINAVGLLDERFTAYGFEDQDYCRRVRAAGLKLGIYDGCFVDHLKLPSTFRGPGGAGDLEAGRRIYVDKWGDESI